MKVMRAMFDKGLFREINQYEFRILNTCEFYKHLNDYETWYYDEEQCCKPESNDDKKSVVWFHIYMQIMKLM